MAREAMARGSLVLQDRKSVDDSIIIIISWWKRQREERPFFDARFGECAL